MPLLHIGVTVMTLILYTGSGETKRNDDILSQVRDYAQRKFQRGCLPRLMAEQTRAARPSLDAMQAVSGVNHAELQAVSTGFRGRVFFIDPLTVEDPDGIQVPQGASLFEMDVRVPYTDVLSGGEKSELNISAVSTIASPENPLYYYRFSLLEQDVDHATSNDPSQRRVCSTQQVPQDRFAVDRTRYDVRHPIMFISPALIQFLSDPSGGSERDGETRRQFHSRFERLMGLFDQDLYRFTHDHFHGTVGRLWWDTDARPASLDQFYSWMEDAPPMFVTPNGPLPNEEILALKHYYQASQWLDRNSPGIRRMRQNTREEILDILGEIEQEARHYGMPTADIDGAMNLMANLLLSRVATISDVRGPQITHLAEYGREHGFPRFDQLWQHGLANGRFRMHEMLKDPHVTVTNGQTVTTAAVIQEFQRGMNQAAHDAPHMDWDMVQTYQEHCSRLLRSMCKVHDG